MIPVRLLWNVLGYVALVLGIIGIALPLLPTTPFILLAAFAFGKGSPRMRRMLEESRYFGPAIRDWEARGAIRPRHKAMACLLMGGSLVASVLLGLGVGLIVVQGAVLLTVMGYLLTRPSA
ncbi:YbaN family protein [Rubellimicrobium arenae]|uniref:YbaN family protein n=1 Tax=Rubellimicrobium arenae TaxID=2817372 RepID=UPI001B30A931|nr:YbaN family protein [Rubellimicrobium arenae]